MIARIYITLKEGVLDPQGKTVQKSLNSLGFKNISDVRVGKYIEVKIDKSIKKSQAQKQIQKMCDELLANTVIENYSFEILRSAQDDRACQDDRV
ncbi:MAG: phosphoribosylformylglycinamidine synthase subunit PurS [Deltaproteobacteria bacterium GWA2_38_16]|nr:MAG: phosphoribosylformylglycinamidine synthase subunit PurS [Deltaproteobacteria bacterium GWA2_38_16]OGQ03172.1 MAG: phosphoribosylformylglycinamidine synthase subunit PurS [Deltaproteobacteria bacterium RIFCSPHIGHO2_02_FULL_38_15]OGQ33767.1 MAG: phosphoribosylformylglycinamidine synthase subunit PurS [Deltaproteobacteria bacterium RIFCSPLOWO2_01_FULL_38_9]HBQ20404.1 phosphoribosylformylglycinamidine synthase subunit PurS [Deltaproteobacteria bacterium]